jgi:hypothetical protein
MPNVGLRRALNCLLAGILGQRCAEKAQEVGLRNPTRRHSQGKMSENYRPTQCTPFLGPNREGTDLCELRAVYEVQERCSRDLNA